MSLYLSYFNRTFAFLLLLGIFFWSNFIFNLIAPSMYSHHAITITESGRKHIHVISSHNKNHQRISFRLHSPHTVPYPQKFLSVPGYFCNKNSDLPPALSNTSVLGFTTTISTDLNILFLGDSLSQQVAQAFDAAVLPSSDGKSRRVVSYFANGPNNTYHHECVSFSAPVRGQGVTAYIRVNGLISRRNLLGRVHCAEHTHVARGALGQENQVNILLRQQYAMSNKNFNVGMFHAVVMRIPHGWIDLNSITRETISEAVSLCHESFGAETVIITSLPLNSNVKSSSDWVKIIEINNMIRDIAKNWTMSTERSGVRWVFVQEFANFTNQVLLFNAQHLGYNVSTPDFSVRDWENASYDAFLSQRLEGGCKWCPSIPMVCADIDAHGTRENCTRNKISPDGMHWCIEYLGSRVSASLACILGCVYNGNMESISESNVRQCVHECNNMFMTVLPIDNTLIRKNLTIFSRVS
ncbi:hypothetical protein ACHAW6_005108 [Cyclotella cf. meneghiniana]